MEKHITLTAIVAALAIAAGAVQAAATAEPMDIEPELLSRLALERAKGNQLGKKQRGVGTPAARDGSNPLAECGAVNIGNVLTGGRPGFQPREVTVVITGDVVNANNRCR